MDILQPSPFCGQFQVKCSKSCKLKSWLLLAGRVIISIERCPHSAICCLQTPCGKQVSFTVPKAGRLACINMNTRPGGAEEQQTHRTFHFTFYSRFHDAISSVHCKIWFAWSLLGWMLHTALIKNTEVQKRGWQQLKQCNGSNLVRTVSSLEKKAKSSTEGFSQFTPIWREIC